MKVATSMSMDDDKSSSVSIKEEVRTGDRIPGANRPGQFKKERRSDQDLRTKLNKLKKSTDAAGDVKEDVNFVKPDPPVQVRKREQEEDPQVLARRQKQIDYGKNTLDYEKYCKLVPKMTRQSEMPKTPNKYTKQSRRKWDGLVKSWKQNIHKIAERLEQHEAYAALSWADACHLEESNAVADQMSRQRIDSDTSDLGFSGDMSSGTSTPRQSVSGVESLAGPEWPKLDTVRKRKKDKEN